MTCPICGKVKTMLVQREYGEKAVEVPAPLYQFSYPSGRNYLPPRCLDCFEKVMARRRR